MNRKTFMIEPVPKPRMTRRDKWLNPPRSCVARYRKFKDDIKALGLQIPESGASINFNITMPKSWSTNKKLAMYGLPHRQTPDLDNFLKAIFDACHINDAFIWDIRISKYWAWEGFIEVIK